MTTSPTDAVLKPHDDGSITLDNKSVQRLMDYGLLHYTDAGWVVGTWNQVTRPTADDGVIERVARAIERTFYEGVDSGKLKGPEAFQVVARAAIAALNPKDREND